MTDDATDVMEVTQAAIQVEPEPTEEQYHQIRKLMGNELGYMPAPTTVGPMWRAVLKTVGALA